MMCSQMLSHKTLVMLLGMDPSQNPDLPLPAHHPQVTFAYTKHLWMSDRREEAYRYVPILLFQCSLEKGGGNGGQNQFYL
jgi:FKBP12-rapamycin complex-associated protein